MCRLHTGLMSNLAFSSINVVCGSQHCSAKVPVADFQCYCWICFNSNSQYKQMLQNFTFCEGSHRAFFCHITSHECVVKSLRITTGRFLVSAPATASLNVRRFTFYFYAFWKQQNNLGINNAGIANCSLGSLSL